MTLRNIVGLLGALVFTSTLALPAPAEVNEVHISRQPLHPGNPQPAGQLAA